MGQIRVKVVPSSSRDAVVGRLGESVKIKVAAPPQRGEANRAVIRLIAEKLRVDRRRVAIVSGHNGAAKVVSVEGLRDAEIAAALGVE